MAAPMHCTSSTMTTAPQLTLATGLVARFAESRRETRTVCQGEVHLVAEDEFGTVILGEVLDVSSSGFRASYREPSLSAGTEVRFRHKFFQGRARVMWSNPILNHTHSGFQVVRDL
jgi:hypothetical protein